LAQIKSPVSEGGKEIERKERHNDAERFVLGNPTVGEDNQMPMKSRPKITMKTKSRMKRQIARIIQNLSVFESNPAIFTSSRLAAASYEGFLK
jgi:hypothetical protein